MAANNTTSERGPKDKIERKGKEKKELD